MSSLPSSYCLEEAVYLFFISTHLSLIKPRPQWFASTRGVLFVMHLPRGDNQGIKLVLRMPPQARTICCQPDRGARWAIFHSVTKSRTRLSMRARRLPCSLYIQGASCGRSKGFTPKTSWLRDDRKKLWETTLPLTPRPAKEDACF